MPDTDFFCGYCDNVIGSSTVVEPFKRGMPGMLADELARELAEDDRNAHWAISLSDYTTTGCTITAHNKYDKNPRVPRVAKVWCRNCGLNLGNLQEGNRSCSVHGTRPIYHFLKIANVKFSSTDNEPRAIKPDENMEMKWKPGNAFGDAFHEAFYKWYINDYSNDRIRPSRKEALKDYIIGQGLSMKPPETEFEERGGLRSKRKTNLVFLDDIFPSPPRGARVAVKTKEEEEQIADAVMMAAQMNHEERSAELAVERETVEPVVVETIVLPATSEAPVEAVVEQPDDAASEASAYTVPSADDGAKADLERQLAGLRAASQADAKTDLLRQLEDLRVAVDRLTTTTVAILARS